MAISSENLKLRMFNEITNVAANEHQGSMKYQENRDQRKMPTKSRGYITGT